MPLGHQPSPREDAQRDADLRRGTFALQVLSDPKGYRHGVVAEVGHSGPGGVLWPMTPGGVGTTEEA